MITSRIQVRKRLFLRSDLEFFAVHCELGTVNYVPSPTLEKRHWDPLRQIPEEVNIGPSLKVVQCVSQHRDAQEVPPHFGGATFEPSTGEVEVPSTLPGEDRPFQAMVLESPAHPTPSHCPTPRGNTQGVCVSTRDTPTVPPNPGGSY